MERRAEDLEVRSVPEVVINGELAPCCRGGAPDESTVPAAGLGQPMG